MALGGGGGSKILVTRNHWIERGTDEGIAQDGEMQLEGKGKDSFAR